VRSTGDVAARAGEIDCKIEVLNTANAD